MSEDKEAFLDRWSRLKQKEQAEQPAPLVEKKEEPVVLPPIEQLTPESDFKPFMDARVDLDTRRSALKKLFADAHYNVPDPFEAYSEDYTVENPIPEAMLKTLNQAKKLLFDEPEKVAQAPAEAAAAAAADGPEAATSTPKADDVAGKQDA